MRSRPRVAEHDLGVVAWAIACAAIVLSGLLAFPPTQAQARSVSFWTQNINEWVLEAVNEFTEETGIEVDVRAISWSLDELLVAHAAGSLPDVWTHGGAALGALAHQGMMAPLDHWIETWEHRDDVAPQVFELGTYQGKVVGLPWRGIEVGAMPYRADFFAEAGLDPERPPQTWEELVEYGRRLVRRDADGTLIRNGFNVSDVSWEPSFWFRLLTMQTGIDVFGDRDHSLTDPRIARAVEFYSELFHRHRLNDPGFFGFISAGTTAMGASPLGGALVRLLEDFVELGGNEQDLRFAVYPHPEEPVVALTGDFIAMSPTASDPEAAFALIEHLLSPEVHERFTYEFGTLPVYRQAVDWDWVAARPQVHVLMELMFSHGRVTTPHPNFFELRQVQNDVMLAARSGAQAVQTVLEQYAAPYRNAWHGVR